MPYIGPWGTFIHIPKTGGTFVRQCLQQLPEYEQSKDISRGTKTHDLPTFWNDGPIWTSVREPADWLLSVWAWMERTAWRAYQHQVPWHTLVDIIREHKNRWPIFIESITSELPGLVGWFYGIHVLEPKVKAYRLGPDLYKKLRDIGADPDKLGVQVNAAPNKKPEITYEQRMMVYNAERATYDRFGFDKPIKN